MRGKELLEIIEASYKHGLEFKSIGELPDYIPQLSRVDKNELSLSVALTNGKVISFGDNKKSFTIQSMVKVLILMCALEEVGEYRVFKNVGIKPSSQAFNSVVGLELSERKPVNPFINAGAIVLVELLGKNAYDLVLNKLICLTGRKDITFSKEVYKSESETGETNRALSYLMKSSGILKKEVDVEALLDQYFKLCSILVTTEDLAKIGAVIANGGKKLGSEEVLIHDRINHIITTLMCTCGMYDYSGEFAMASGLPAKSGVSGGILSLSLGDMGIGVYSPGLDSHGNSVAGMKMLSYLSHKLCLNIYRRHNHLVFIEDEVEK